MTRNTSTPVKGWAVMHSYKTLFIIAFNSRRHERQCHPHPAIHPAMNTARFLLSNAVAALSNFRPTQVAASVTATWDPAGNCGAIGTRRLDSVRLLRFAARLLRPQAKRKSRHTRQSGPMPSMPPLAR